MAASIITTLISRILNDFNNFTAANRILTAVRNILTDIVIKQMFLGSK